MILITLSVERTVHTTTSPLDLVASAHVHGRGGVAQVPEREGPQKGPNRPFLTPAYGSKVMVTSAVRVNGLAISQAYTMYLLGSRRNSHEALSSCIVHFTISAVPSTRGG